MTSLLSNTAFPEYGLFYYTEPDKDCQFQIENIHRNNSWSHPAKDGKNHFLCHNESKLPLSGSSLQGKCAAGPEELQDSDENVQFAP